MQKKLPQGTKVGLEYHPDFTKPFTVDGHKFQPNTAVQQYWDNIIAACDDKQIIPLDDPDIYREYSRSLLEEDARKKQLSHYRLEKGATKEGQRERREALYRAQVTSDYIFEIKREEGIFNQIGIWQPQVVILGGAHADYVALRQEEIKKRFGISVKQFSKEDIPTERPVFTFDDLANNRRKVQRVTAYLLDEVSPDPAVLLRREAVIRRHRAATEGKIIEGGRPAFVGTWDLQTPSHGLFEIYPEGNNGFSGRIEDGFGTAVFKGNIDGNRIAFRKYYDFDRAVYRLGNEDVFEQAIEYEAQSSDGEHFAGFFRIPGVTSGNFEMNRVLQR